MCGFVTGSVNPGVVAKLIYRVEDTNLTQHYVVYALVDESRIHHQWFLGAFGKLRKRTLGFVSVRPSAGAYAWLPLDGFF